MMNTRLFTLRGKSNEELEDFITAMNAKADEIVAEGGVWQTYNSQRSVDVYPVRVQTNFLDRKSVLVRALNGMPFMLQSSTGRRMASAEAYVWPEDLFKNETEQK
jgi:hypothetical protein